MRHGCLLIISALFSLNAFAAGNFSFLPQGTGPEKEFQGLMNAGDFKHALAAWDTSFTGTSFAQSANGTGTLAYLLYQNGMPYTALQTLISSTQPQALDANLLRLWKTELKNSVFIQKGWIQTTGGWKSIVDNSPLTIRLTTKKDFLKAFAQASAVPADNVNEKARIWWQIATQSATAGFVDSGLQAIKLMRESGQRVIGQDQLALTQGRLLYQKNELEPAISAYLQIPKSSSLWVESVEERAWAHMRQADYDKALGDVTTALSPVLTPLAGPETYFLAHLLDYRVCDYTRLFDNSEAFKTKHRARLNELQALAKTGTNKAINGVFDRFDQRGVSQESAGADVEFMPRQLFRDSQFIRAMESRRQLLSEIKKSAQLSESTKVLGSNRLLERELANNRSKADRFRQIGFQRARTLAAGDLKEYRMVLNKMNIIEGEVIQRLHLDDNLKGERSKLSKLDDNSESLVFPYTNEVWMDELDNYKAQVKDCPTLKGASL